jgi:hypothetical protein
VKLTTLQLTALRALAVRPLYTYRTTDLARNSVHPRSAAVLCARGFAINARPLVPTGARVSITQAGRDHLAAIDAEAAA